MARLFLTLGAVSAAIAVACGALGAHALRDRLDGRMMETFEAAVRYQMYHALALLVVAWVAERSPGSLVSWAGWLFAGGTVLFSGSLYALSLGGPRWLGPVTPLGGLSFLGGWLCLAMSAWKGSGP